MGLVLSFFCPLLSDVALNKVLDRIEFQGLTNPKLIQSIQNYKFEVKTGRKILKNDLDKDVKNLFLMGTFSEVDVKSRIENHQHTLIFIFKENPVIQNIKLIINGNEVQSLPKSIIITSHVGDVLNMQNLEADLASIKRWYQQKDYFLFDVENVEFTDECLYFSIKIAVVNHIQIKGAKRNPKQILLRELRLKQGEPLTQQNLSNAKRFLIKTNYFKYVSPAQVKASGKKNAYNLEFEVIEKKLNRIEGGLETDEEDFVGFIQTNFHHSMIKSDQIATKIQIGNQDDRMAIRTYSIAYTQPWLANKWPIKTSFQAWLAMKQEVLASQSGLTKARLVQDNREGVALMATFPFKNPFYSVQVKYKYEQIYPVNETDFQAYKLSSLSNALIYNDIGMDFNPQKGRYWKLSYENGGNIASINLSGLDFWRVEADYSQFIPIYGFIFAQHFKVNIFESNEEQDTLEVEKYILGGGSTIRGYRDKSYPFVGPHRVILNTELRKNISKKWQAILFIDAGKILDDSNLIDQFKKPELGMGVGVRYFSILGPVRVDIGHSKLENTIHFSLGQLF